MTTRREAFCVVLGAVVGWCAAMAALQLTKQIQCDPAMNGRPVIMRPVLPGV